MGVRLLLLVACVVVNAVPQVSREAASSFLKFKRVKRANKGEPLEKFQEGNMERECVEEICDWVEANELPQFEQDKMALNEWWEEQHDPSIEDDPTGVIVGCVVGFLVLVIIVVIIVAVRKSGSNREQNYKYPQAPPPYAVAQGNFHTAHPQMPQIRIRDDNLRLHVANCYIDRQKVKLGSKIKEGNFGVVFKAKWHCGQADEPPRVVAAKTLKNIENANQLEDFLREGVMMREFNHPNVLKIYGVCTAPGEYPIIVLPYMKHGDLRTFLRNQNTELTVQDLLGFCVQIAAGMEHLASKRFVHRDLAARNVFVTDDESRQYCLKIGDFGLSRDLHHRDYYRSGQHTELPLKWMAPEAIERQFYTEKSDVWSYGVTIWETMTRAISPFATVEPLHIIEHIKAGNRMNKPECCPEKLYALMKSCWHIDAERRPTFSTCYRRVMSIHEERQAMLDEQNSRARNNRTEEHAPLNTTIISTHSTRAAPNDYGPDPTIES